MIHEQKPKFPDIKAVYDVLAFIRDEYWLVDEDGGNISTVVEKHLDTIWDALIFLDWLSQQEEE